MHEWTNNIRTLGSYKNVKSSELLHVVSNAPAYEGNVCKNVLCTKPDLVLLDLLNIISQRRTKRFEMYTPHINTLTFWLVTHKVLIWFLVDKIKYFIPNYTIEGEDKQNRKCLSLHIFKLYLMQSNCLTKSNTRTENKLGIKS